MSNQELPKVIEVMILIPNRYRGKILIKLINNTENFRNFIIGNYLFVRLKDTK